MPSSIPWPAGDIEWVSADIIRRAFNDGQFWERVLMGEATETVFKERHLSTHEREPFCTLSQIVVYWDAGDSPIAIVHQYKRPDGSLGASGRPDPKRIVLGQRILATRASTAPIETDDD